LTGNCINEEQSLNSNDQKKLPNPLNAKDLKSSKQMSFEQQLQKKKSVAQTLIEKEEQELTFKPKINKTPD